MSRTPNNNRAIQQIHSSAENPSLHNKILSGDGNFKQRTTITTDSRQTGYPQPIKYHDSFVKQKGKWLFAERKLMVDWIENR